MAQIGPEVAHTMRPRAKLCSVDTHWLTNDGAHSDKVLAHLRMLTIVLHSCVLQQVGRLTPSLQLLQRPHDPYQIIEGAAMLPLQTQAIPCKAAVLARPACNNQPLLITVSCASSR
jgi:hypothetical protein